MSLNPVAKPS